MITSLRIQNFKAWKDTGEIRMAPLTVFFGRNSSGKTSILQLLLMLKQTAEWGDRGCVLHLADSRTPMDLGVFQDIVHGRDEAQPVRFDIGWQLPERLAVTDSGGTFICLGDALRFRASVGHVGPGPTPIGVRALSYHLVSGGVEGLSITLRQKQGHLDEYVLDTSPDFLVRRPGGPWPLPAPVRFYGFPDEVIAYHQNAGFVADLALQLERLLRGVQYLGPLRAYPARTHTWLGDRPEHVGGRGHLTVPALLGAQDRHIGRGGRAQYRPFEEVVARWLGALGLVASFKTECISERSRQYEVMANTSPGVPWVNLADVGFGVSQVLPVIVQCFCGPCGSTVILEQPDIHLHPSAQAELADLFIEALHARELGRDRHVQLIVESHSEHLLHRLQRRIAEQRLSPSDVAIYFCEMGTPSAKLTELEVDDLGNIRNWPRDFFGDDMGDLVAMTEAAAQREQGDDA